MSYIILYEDTQKINEPFKKRVEKKAALSGFMNTVYHFAVVKCLNYRVILRFKEFLYIVINNSNKQQLHFNYEFVYEA